MGIVKIIEGGHIDVMNDEEIENGFSDLWERFLNYLKASGKFGKIFAKILETYKDRVIAMVKKVMASGSDGLIKIIHDIRDDIVKIIEGGHIDVMDDEEIENGFSDLWERFLNYLRKSGKFGIVFAKILDTYKDRVIAMVKKVMASGSDGLIKIIHDIRDDIVKIIEGGHIDVMDDEEIENGFSDLWEKFLNYLRASGKFGKIFAKILETYKDRVIAMVKKVMASGSDGLIKIIHDIRDDIVKIIQGGHIDVMNHEEKCYDISSRHCPMMKSHCNINGIRTLCRRTCAVC